MNDSSLLPILMAFTGGALIGGGAIWLTLRARLQTEDRLLNAFKALASDTLNQNSEAFLQLAEGKFKQSEISATATLKEKETAIDEMVKPVKETLKRMDEQLQAIEIKREGAYKELAEMVTTSRESQTMLRKETSQLLQALRAPTGRGRWGELQLQRILEMTGMSIHTKDFSTQYSLTSDEGTIRPDFVVALPGGRSVIIDSKVPLTAYLNAIQSDEKTLQTEALKDHARHVKSHIKALSKKEYWKQFEDTPEFVVLFLPGEHFLSAALDGDPDLMEYSVKAQIVLATPMTLIALLRTISYGWRQEALRENVMQIADIGTKLHSALFSFAAHIQKLGKSLNGSVDAYNKTVASLERNVLSKAKQLSSFGAIEGEKTLPSPDIIEKTTRPVTMIEDKDN